MKTKTTKKGNSKSVPMKLRKETRATMPVSTSTPIMKKGGKASKSKKCC